MGIRASWGIVALLGFACVGEAGDIVAHRTSASSAKGAGATRPADAELGRWEKRLHDAIARTGKLGDHDFDALFGDDFFRRRYDPFSEVDRVGRQLEEGLDASDRGLFDTSFRDWFSKRMDLTGITTKVADEGKNVEVTFDIPGLDEDSARFDVNANRIRFRYDARKEETQDGRDVRTSEKVEKVLPLPAGADPNGFEVRKGKDEITLVFHRIGQGA
jgi:HSP20 family molecular chaperone IbpA